VITEDFGIIDDIDEGILKKNSVYETAHSHS
jgi:hypothetical protein